MKTQIWPLDESNYKETLKGVCILVGEDFVTIFAVYYYISLSLHPSLPSFLLCPLMPEVVSQIPFPYPSLSRNAPKLSTTFLVFTKSREPISLITSFGVLA